MGQDVASYRKGHYVTSRSATGPKLEEVYIYCGDMNNYYLNNAVYLMENFLRKTNNPNYVSRLRCNTIHVPKILKRISDSATKGTRQQPLEILRNHKN